MCDEQSSPAREKSESRLALAVAVEGELPFLSVGAVLKSTGDCSDDGDDAGGLSPLTTLRTLVGAAARAAA